MTIDVAPVDDAEEWDELHGSDERSLLYSSWAYRAFLERILPDARPVYLGARSGGRLVGALPLFVSEAPAGTVVNSLPFYGSNGGAVIHPSVPPDPVRTALLHAVTDVAADASAAFTTVVTNPLLDDAERYEAHGGWAYVDQRIGQLTPLPAAPADAGDAILDLVHQKTRNTIRKALKTGVVLGQSDDPAVLAELAEIHRENMADIGGAAKPPAVFEAIRDTFAYGRQHRVYTARLDGELCAALLVLVSNRTVEYFTPVTRAEHRSLQPMSGLIFEAMKDAVAEGHRWWNWGGTWLSQHGVHAFKARWGTVDLPYRYFVAAGDGAESVRALGADGIGRAFPWFYVLPFHALGADDGS